MQSIMLHNKFWVVSNYSVWFTFDWLFRGDEHIKIYLTPKAIYYGMDWNHYDGLPIEKRATIDLSHSYVLINMFALASVSFVLAMCMA